MYGDHPLEVTTNQGTVDALTHDSRQGTMTGMPLKTPLELRGRSQPSSKTERLLAGWKSRI
jgi:hypothetical protein